ncbi:uncharacterized protein LOC113473411, partial [Diaphorina citri]|uniref:Uncharacterized protein LOC113473411 n=1 Tax=Diaphorina citri TaxID=121845 RepID=A0A3Q0JKK6_DIACI
WGTSLRSLKSTIFMDKTSKKDKIITKKTYLKLLNPVHKTKFTLAWLQHHVTEFIKSEEWTLESTDLKHLDYDA